MDFKRLPHDVFGLVCSFVADDPLWLFVVWARVCRGGPCARPPPRPFALRLNQIRGPVPRTFWAEWPVVSSLTCHYPPTARLALFNDLEASGVCVQALSLPELQLAGEEEEGLGLRRLRALHGLEIDGCRQLTDAVLGHLHGLRGMRWLCLRWCEGAGARALGRLAGSLPGLQRLDLDGCSAVTDETLACLAGLPKLQRLSLADCTGWTGAGLAFLSGLSQLRHLDLGGCAQLAEGDLEHLAGLRQMRCLILRDCPQLTSHGLARLAWLTGLRHVDLGGCTGLDDGALTWLAGLPALRHLVLHGCRGLTTPALAARLPALRGLRKLDLSFCPQLADPVAVGFAGLRRLHSLDLSRSAWLSDAGVVHVARLRSLRCLRVTHCQLTDAGLAVLAAAPSELTDLCLESCSKLTTAGVAGLLSHPRLRRVDLGLCHGVDPRSALFSGTRSGGQCVLFI